VTRENAQTKARRYLSEGRPGAKALGLEALARAVRHRRWRAVHARRSRPGVSDRREPGSAEKEREPKPVHRLIVPATRRATGASGVPFSDSLLMHPDSLPGLALRLVVPFGSDLPLWRRRALALLLSLR
jgi:hypothetical protein